MHYLLEIIMPPTKDINAAVKEILEPFNENGYDEDESGKYGFYDWYVIGGRFAGTKQQSSLDAEKLDAFQEEIQKREFTVSGIQAGKPSLNPASQIPVVDQLWGEFFPHLAGKPCLLFSHSNNQYDSESALPSDVITLAEVTESMSASRVIIAGLNHDDTRLEAKEMYADSLYNGCTFQDTTWDSKLKSALAMYGQTLKNYRPEYAEKVTPNNSWLVVTVDYHT